MIEPNRNGGFKRHESVIRNARLHRLLVIILGIVIGKILIKKHTRLIESACRTHHPYDFRNNNWEKKKKKFLFMMSFDKLMIRRACFLIRILR